MRPHLLACLGLFLFGGAASAEPIEGTLIPLPAPDGWAITPDGVTLFISQAEQGRILVFDTIAERETRKIEVDFKPGAMAMQGDTLFVAARGSSSLHLLDAKSGKERKEIALEGAGIANLACHPVKGPVFASTKTLKVYMIDAAAGTVATTSAKGDFLAVDPNNGSVLFTGIQPPRNEEEILIQDLPDGRIKILFDRWGTRALLLKYAVKDKELKLVSSQRNAAVGAHGITVTPDGKKVFLPSRAGWRAPVEGGTAEGLATATFSTENLITMTGEAPGGSNYAFHPVLNSGVVNQQGRSIQFFNPKSLVKGKQFEVAKGADERAILVTFAAKGTKVVLWNGDNPKNPQEGLHFLPVELKAEDRAALEKVYGKLPAAVAQANPGTTTPTPKGTTPMPKGTTPGQVDPEPPANGNVLAASGFNSAKGINAGGKLQPPFPLGKTNAPGGIGERGWSGLWAASQHATFVKDNAFEGDGYLKLTATENYKRAFSKPQTGSFVVEAVLRAPIKDGGGTLYIWKDSAFACGPMVRIRDGKFLARDGGNEMWVEVAKVKPDAWCKVVVEVDVEAKNYKVRMDGKPFMHEFGFRSDVNELRELDFLVEGKETLHVDAIRVLKQLEK